jgi:hypothetical protein
MASWPTTWRPDHGHCIIRDCSYGIMELRNVAEAEFNAVVFSTAGNFTMLGFWNSGVRFDPVSSLRTSGSWAGAFVLRQQFQCRI